MTTSNSNLIIDERSILMKALDFTADDLEANRRGEMTERQRFFLRQSRKGPIYHMIFSVVGAIALICYALSTFHDTTWLCLSCLYCGLGFGVAFLRAANEHDAVLRDLSAHLLSIEGRAERSSYQTDPLFNSNSHRHYYVTIGNIRRHPVSKKVYEAFTPGRYRVYYAPNTTDWLSAEWLGSEVP